MGDFVTGYGDELNYAWIYNWVIHAVTSGSYASLFQTNIFYPYQIGLSDSDPNLVTSLLSIIPYYIIKEPIVVVNFTLISSLALLGFSVYMLCFYLTKDFFASLLAGSLIIFSPAVLSFYVHLQMIAVWYVPLAIMFFLRFLKEKRGKYLLASLLFFVLQTYNNFLAGYFILFSYAIIFIFYLSYQRKQLKNLIGKKYISFFIFAFILILPIAYPYYQVSKEFHYTRDIKDAVHLALQPEDLLYTWNINRLYQPINSLPFNKASQNGEFKPGYLGLIFSLLAILTLVMLIKNFKKKDLVNNSFLAISLTGLVLSLGPVLHLGRYTIHNPFPIPLPYALFYYIVPGFQGFRNAARWEMLFILLLAVLCALVLVKILKKYSTKTKIIIYCILIVGCFAEGNFPMHLQKIISVKDFPKVYSWLATTPENTKIIEMPIYSWNMAPYSDNEFWRMYYSTIHFRRTVNGGGGFTPPPWIEMVYELDASFPSPNALEKLDTLGLQYIIVHKNEYDIIHDDRYLINDRRFPSGNEVIKRLSENNHMQFVKKFGNDYVYFFK